MWVLITSAAQNHDPDYLHRIYDAAITEVGIKNEHLACLLNTTSQRISHQRSGREPLYSWGRMLRVTSDPLGRKFMLRFLAKHIEQLGGEYQTALAQEFAELIDRYQVITGRKSMARAELREDEKKTA